MAAFDYVAVDPSGRTVSGAVVAADEPSARALLGRRKLMTLELVPARAAVARAEPGAKGPVKLDARTLALTTRQLATPGC